MANQRNRVLVGVLCVVGWWVGGVPVTSAQAGDTPVETPPQGHSDEGAHGPDADEATQPDGVLAPNATPDATAGETEVADPAAASDAAEATPGLPTPEPVVELPTETPEAPAEEEEEEVLLAFEPGEGVLIATPDHRFEMNIRSRGMLLLTFEVPEADDMGVRPDPGFDLDVRRARINIQGRMFEREIRYRLQLAVAPRDMLETSFADVANSGSFSTLGAPHRSPLLDWYVEFQQLRELHVRVGQFIVPYNRSRVVSSSSMQLVDRSLASGEFNLDRDLGVQLYSPDFMGMGWLRYYLGVFANEGRDGLFGADLGLMYVARLEVLPFGVFNDYSEGDVERGETPRLSIGASYAFLDDSHLVQGTLGRVPNDAGTFDFHNFEIDVAFLFHGFSFYSELMWREGTHTMGPTMVDPTTDRTIVPRNGMGWYAQAGIVLPETPVELAARYGFVRPLGAASAAAERSELGGGVNVYIHRHAFKLQLDYFHLWDDSPGELYDGNSTAFERGEERVRVMFQASL